MSTLSFQERGAGTIFIGPILGSIRGFHFNIFLEICKPPSICLLSILSSIFHMLGSNFHATEKIKIIRQNMRHRFPNETRKPEIEGITFKDSTHLSVTTTCLSLILTSQNDANTTPNITSDCGSRCKETIK